MWLWQGCNLRQFVALQFWAPAPSTFVHKFNVNWRCYFPNNTKIEPSVACARCDALPLREWQQITCRTVICSLETWLIPLFYAVQKTLVLWCQNGISSQVTSHRVIVFLPLQEQIWLGVWGITLTIVNSSTLFLLSLYAESVSIIKYIFI